MGTQGAATAGRLEWIKRTRLSDPPPRCALPIGLDAGSTLGPRQLPPRVQTTVVNLKRIVLDVLKPHQPDALEFARAVAACGHDYRVKLTVIEMDDKTETLQVVVEGSDVDMVQVREAVNQLGGSLHSIDEVEVHAAADAE